MSIEVDLPGDAQYWLDIERNEDQTWEVHLRLADRPEETGRTVNLSDSGERVASWSEVDDLGYLLRNVVIEELIQSYEAAFYRVS